MSGPMTKQAALIRAVALVPHPGTGLRTWMSIDAVLAEDVWVCVLEDLHAVHIVEVDSHTGDVRLTGSYRRRLTAEEVERAKRSGAMTTRAVRCGGRPAPTWPAPRWLACKRS